MKRRIGEPNWVTVRLDAAATVYQDNAVSPGDVYEYLIRRDGLNPGDFVYFTAMGGICASIDGNLVEWRGKIILLVDETHSSPLSVELSRLVQDLTGDGWGVIRRDVSPRASVAEVRSLIKEVYSMDPANVRSVFLFGRIPVPYSGDIYPDAHGDHRGAWPADVIYGDMDGEYTDTQVSSGGGRNSNVPGDGRFDQSVIAFSSTGRLPELEVGRVDLSHLPSFSKPEVELLRDYLNKNHNYRHRTQLVERRALVDDNFGVLDGWEALASNGWRNFAPLVGPENVAAEDYIETLSARTYLWAYGCGGGGYESCSGVASTRDFASRDLNAVFNLLYGSYFGDWDTADNLLRAPLARGAGLVSIWAGRPNWYLHPMGAGFTIGFCTKMNQGNTGLYPALQGGNQVHIALMGDPSLRLFPVAPATALSGVKNEVGGIDLEWAASEEPVLGYHVYSADSPDGAFSRISSSLITRTRFSDSGNPSGKTYMVRAVKLESTPSGTFHNPSQGVFLTIPRDTAPAMPEVAVDASKAVASELGPIPGNFRIFRVGNIQSALQVAIAFGGSAVNGTSFSPLPETVTIPAGENSADVSILPIPGNVSAKGEKVILSIVPKSEYRIGAAREATVQIVPTPMKAWKAIQFTAEQLADPEASGDLADPDGDGNLNVIEYAFNRNPLKSDTAEMTTASVQQVDGRKFLELKFRRNKSAADLLWSIESADDARGPWRSDTAETEVIEIRDLHDGSEEVLVRHKTPIDSSPFRFMRVRLTR